MEQYKPGLHLLATFTAPETALQDIEACRALFDRLISANQLVKVGETYHSFPGSGFTATVCLTESHISIHTWPEYGHATFDVFLSNYKMDNEPKVRAIYNAVIGAFTAVEVNRHEIRR
jgi:S-adenosylmethionine decarboxylase